MDNMGGNKQQNRGNISISRGPWTIGIRRTAVRRIFQKSGPERPRFQTRENMGISCGFMGGVMGVHGHWCHVFFHGMSHDSCHDISHGPMARPIEMDKSHLPCFWFPKGNHCKCFYLGESRFVIGPSSSSSFSSSLSCSSSYLHPCPHPPWLMLTSEFVRRNMWLLPYLIIRKPSFLVCFGTHEGAWWCMKVAYCSQDSQEQDHVPCARPKQRARNHQDNLRAACCWWLRRFPPHCGNLGDAKLSSDQVIKLFGP